MEKRKMLVVDDTLFNRQVLCGLFEPDFDVLQAADGEEALALIRRFALSLAVVLLDLIMPKLDGLDVLREMNGDPALRVIPVIVTSAASDETFRLKAFELGAVDYISAPFNPILAKLRVKSALAPREYERLRLQNEMLRVQGEEDAGYRALLEDAHTSVLEFDSLGCILRYDATIQKELAGTYDSRQLTEIFRADQVAEAEDVARLAALFRRVIDPAGVVSDYEDMELRRANGSRAWFRLRLLRKTGPGQDRLVMSITNIDRQKREEEATHAQLIRALNAAESASAAKGEFMSRMSHEIRTPLNAVIGFISLSRQSIGDDKRISEYLAKTEFTSRHLLSIVNDVLDMSAIEAGQMTLSYESYNLRELINAVTAMVYPTIHKKNIQFQILLENVNEEALLGDKLRLSQILLNLLSNAVKFTPQNGDVVLTVGQHEIASHRIIMEFVVKDSGVGMSKEFLERLGQPFEQQDASVSARFGGSGLGLSITKKLIKLMNGALAIESIEGRGSTFTVSLPVDVEQNQPEADLAYAFAEVNALVIDREEIAAEHTRACFRSLGCRCDCAVSGQSALILCQSNNYNLVLMDWKLPDLNGWSIIEAVRQAVDNEPAIFIMAYDYTEISKEAADGLGFVNKPIFQSSVLDLLLQLYGKYEVKPMASALPNFKGRRLLLAEDNILNSEIAEALLHAMGFSVTVVINGREAYDAFMNSDPGGYDIILMDVQMPVMDGYEATRRIRASRHPQAQTIPILAMSADAFSQDVAAALNCGMNGHIAKPIDGDSMSKTIAEHLSAAH